MCSSPRRLPSMRSSGLPAIGNPRAMPQPMPLHLTLEGGHTRAPPGGATRASPGCQARRLRSSSHRRPPTMRFPRPPPRKRPIGGGASPGMGATLSTGGLVSTRGLASYELAVWVVLFMDTGPRATRRPIAGLSHNHADPDPRTNDRGETTFGPPTQFDHWTQYLNAAKANLGFPSRFSAGFWCNHLPPPATVSLGVSE